MELSLGLLSSILALGTRHWAKRQTQRRWTLAAPALWILCLGLCSTIVQPLIGEPPILIALTYAAIVWGGIRVAFLLAPNRETAWLCVAALCGMILLTLLQLRAPLVEHLDSFTFTMFGLRFSLMKVFEVFILLTGLVWITRAAHRWMAAQIRQMQDVDPTFREWLVKLSELLLYFLALVCVLAVCRIDVTTLAVFSGALGVSMGLGLQKIVSNYVSGLILLFEKTVKVGDLVELEGGPKGRIYRLDPRGTFVLCTDGSEIIIPNEEFVSKKVTNWTFSNTRGQVTIPVCIAYGSDVEKAQSLLIDAAREHPLCLAEPAPTCNLQEFGGHGLHMVLQFWVGDIAPGTGSLQSEVMVAMLKKLTAAHIEIPKLPHFISVPVPVPSMEAETVHASNH